LAVYGVWGAAMALAVCYGLLLADPLLLRPLQVTPAPRQIRGRYRHFALAVALGTACAGLALLVLGVLGALDLPEDTLVAPLGFLAGLGLALALYGQPAAGWRATNWSSWLRLAVAAAGSALVQWILDANPGRGVGTAIAWPYTRYAAYFTAVLDRWWPGLTGRFPGWAYTLGRVDAALAGAVLALGITLGMIAAARRLPERPPGPAGPGTRGGQDPAPCAGR
jgi:hypothetical protein